MLWWSALSLPSPAPWIGMSQLEVFQLSALVRGRSSLWENLLPQGSLEASSPFHCYLTASEDSLGICCPCFYFHLPGHIILIHSLEPQQLPGFITWIQLSPPQSLDQAHGSTLKFMMTCPLKHPLECKDIHFSSKYYTHTLNRLLHFAKESTVFMQMI